MSQTLTMSRKERERLVILARLQNDELTHAEAAEALGVSQRQLWRIRSTFTRQDEAGLVHRLRGVRSNRGYPQQTRERAATMLQESSRLFI